jgi:hypothetical protein
MAHPSWYVSPSSDIGTCHNQISNKLTYTLPLGLYCLHVVPPASPCRLFVLSCQGLSQQLNNSEGLDIYRYVAPDAIMLERSRITYDHEIPTVARR